MDLSVSLDGPHSDDDMFTTWGSEVPDAQPASPPPVPSPSQQPLGAVGIAAGAIIAVGAVIRLLGANSAGYSSSYRAGEVAGTVAAVVAGGCLFLWGVRRIRSSEHAPYSVSPQRRRATVAIVTVVVLAVSGALVAAAWGPGSQASASSWNSQQGTSDHAGFISGCQGSGVSTPRCECVFSRLIADPQYSTPAGFETLNAAAEQYVQTGNAANLPVAYVQAAQGCVGSTSPAPPS